MADDLRSIVAWSPTATAGTTTRLEWVAASALTSLAIHLGGSESDADDLTGATAYPATIGSTKADGTVVGAGRVATVDLAIPTTGSTPIRLVVDGVVQTYGQLHPRMNGRTDLDADGNSFTLAPAVAASFSLTVLGGVTQEGGGGTGTHPDLAAHDTLGLATQVELDAEATTRASADTALDGRLGTVEATLPAKADLVAGVVPTAQLPAIAIDSKTVVADQTARLALTTVQPGDVAVQTSDSTFWLLVDTDPALAASWKQLDRADAVSSVNSQTGSVVLGKADVGLGSVDNTSDANKPVSTAQQTALDDKAPLASPALTGTPTVPTAIAGTNTTQAASTAFVKTATDNAASGAVNEGDAAGGVLSGTYPNPGFAADMATQAELDAVAAAKENTLNAAGVVAKFTGTPDGTKFLRDDGTLVTPSGGGGSAGSVAVVRAGYWHNSPLIAAGNPSSTSWPIINRAYVTPFYMPPGTVVTALGVNVTTAGGASNVVRMGIFDDASGVPGAIHEQGTVAGDSTGAKTLTLGTPYTVPSTGLFHVACAPQGSGSPGSTWMGVAELSAGPSVDSGASWSAGYGAAARYFSSSGAFTSSPTLTLESTLSRFPYVSARVQ